MDHSGELLSVVVAVSWTVSALLSESASKRMGEAVANVYRMLVALVMLYVVLAFSGGTDLLFHANSEAWLWLIGSGLVGYTFGDYCLYNAYIKIGSRFGQLFMTLAPLFAALSAWFLLGELLSLKALIGMLVTLLGIAMTILNRRKDESGHSHFSLNLPRSGVLLAIGAALGQGVGLVMSKIGLNAMPVEGGMAPVAGTLMRCVAGLVGFVIMLFLRRKQSGMRNALTGANMGLLIALAVFGPVVGVTLSLRAAQLTDVGVAQTIMSLSPVLILIPYHFVQKQPVSLRDVLWTVVSFIGVALFFV
ncbi:MAG: DMT family transporter [Bacteroidales bacterium]|nr:DMT family transporter [Bacteroidales bacterium]